MTFDFAICFNQYDSISDLNVNSYLFVDVSLLLESLINYLAMALSLFKFVPEHVAS